MRHSGSASLAWVGLLLLSVAPALAFPVYTSANGTTTLQSAFGGNIVLVSTRHPGPAQPGLARPGPAPRPLIKTRGASLIPTPQDPYGGNVVARALLQAQAGVALNGTVLNEQLLSSLAGVLSGQSLTLTNVTETLHTSAEQLSLLMSLVSSLVVTLSTASPPPPPSPTATPPPAPSAAAASAAPLCGILDDQTQCNALVALLKSTTWKQDVDVASSQTYCRWPGISCGGLSGSDVTHLSFRGKGYEGHLPSQIGWLTAMLSLDVSGNPGLLGQLPDSLSALVVLTALNISNTGLTGVIPAVWDNIPAMDYRNSSIQLINNPDFGILTKNIASD